MLEVGGSQWFEVSDLAEIVHLGGSHETETIDYSKFHQKSCKWD